MAQHWRDRLNRLALKQHQGEQLTKSERRQLRKLLGRRAGIEWRLFGHGNLLHEGDDLGREVVRNWKLAEEKLGLTRDTNDGSTG